MDFLAQQSALRAVSRLQAAFAVVLLVAGFASLALLALGLWGLVAERSWAAVSLLAGAPLLPAVAAVVGLARELRRLDTLSTEVLQGLGARPLDERDPSQRRLREVAEEAAVVAGVPVPDLYLLEHPGIDALALGARPAVSAVLVTRGALEHLDAARLRTVMVRQIALIAWGEAAPNLRLAAALQGLASSQQAGLRLLSRAGRASAAACARSSQARTLALARAMLCRPVFAIGGASLWLTGAPGVIIGGLLPAVLDPRRAYCAPAMAPSFTEPWPAAPEAAPRRLAADVWAGFRGPSGGPWSTTPAAVLVARLREGAPPPESACWLCALVVGGIDREVSSPEDPRVRVALRWLLSPAGAFLRVPVLELMLARSRGWSSMLRGEVLERCRRLLRQDDRSGAAQWVHLALARHRLLPPLAEPRSWSERSPSRIPLSRALGALFALAASIGESSARRTRDTLAETAALIGVPRPAATPDELDSDELGRALDLLVWLPSPDKPVLLGMLARLTRKPGDPDFHAFVRAVAAAIDCPMPGAGGEIPISL
jgi:hypothetical protein